MNTDTVISQELAVCVLQELLELLELLERLVVALVEELDWELD